MATRLPLLTQNAGEASSGGTELGVNIAVANFAMTLQGSSKLCRAPPP